MEEEQTTPGEVFNFIMSKLSELGAKELITEINTTIRRGVVEGMHSDSIEEFRPMKDVEKLSIALQYVIANFEIPIMLDRSKKILQCQEIIWTPELDEQQQEPSGLVTNLDEREYNLLPTLLSIVEECEIPIPEVA